MLFVGTLRCHTGLQHAQYGGVCLAVDYKTGAEGAHAAGFELRLLEERSQRSLRLRISDDGRGKPEGRRAEATARGIAMMERLAGDLGAPLAIGPARPGWVVELTLKL